ncbi:MAG TPA: hypothetical protein VGD08_20185 [Stellaceae bacterium]|jgi:hypothetical protein
MRRRISAIVGTWRPAAVAASGIIVAAVVGGSAASAAEPPCRSEIGDVQRQVAEAQVPAAKEAQIRALLEQVDRACKENDEVVASAGLDQVRAILKEQRKPS